MIEQHDERRISIEVFNKVADDVRTIKTALLGDMDNPGWLSRIRSVENSIRLCKKFLMVMGSAIVAICINIVSKFF